MDGKVEAIKAHSHDPMNAGKAKDVVNAAKACTQPLCTLVGCAKTASVQVEDLKQRQNLINTTNDASASLQKLLTALKSVSSLTQPKELQEVLLILA